MIDQSVAKESAGYCMTHLISGKVKLTAVDVNGDDYRKYGQDEKDRISPARLRGSGRGGSGK